MVASHRLVPLLFLPAGVGLLKPVLVHGPLDQRLLALGFLLLAVDQARMARLDLANIQAVQIQLTARASATISPVLTTFNRLTWGTIFWELLGFYSGAFHLGWGIILVLSSQVCFNALATIHLIPGAPKPLQPKPLGEKWGLVAANSCGIALILLWMADVMPWAIVLGLWAIAFVYAGVKIVQSINPPTVLAKHPDEASVSTIDATKGLKDWQKSQT